MGLRPKGAENIYQGVLISLMVIFLSSMNPAKCASFPQEAFIQIVYQDGSLSINLRNARVSAVFQELALKTSYEFALPEGLLENRITLKFSDVDLDKGIRRILIKAGADNYALVYSLRESNPGKDPLYRVKVVLMGSDLRESKETSSHQASFAKPSEPTEQAVIQSESFPVVQEESVPSERPLSDEGSMELVPQVLESLPEELPTPVELSPETEDFPVYRALESNEIPMEPQRLSPP